MNKGFASPALSAQAKEVPSKSTSGFLSPSAKPTSGEDSAPSSVSPVSAPTGITPSTTLSLSKQQVDTVGSSTLPNNGRGKRGPNKLKKLKDPLAPKKALSSFMLFASEERPKIVTENSNMTMGEVSKEIGRRWASLNEETKKSWELKGQAAKAEHEEALKAYKPSEEFLKMKDDHDKKMQEKKLAKGRGSSGNSVVDYFQYVSENWRRVSASNPGVSGLQIQTILWEQWGSTSSPVVKKMKKDVKVPDASETTHKSSFNVFVDQMKSILMKEMPELESEEVIGALELKWSEMSDVEKSKFKA